MKHLIIGNGPAGVVAAETLRKLDANAQIVLVGDEPEPPYSRMAIPYLLMGDIDEAGTYLRKDAGHFDRLSIRLVNARAERIDTGACRVTFSGGGAESYDRLLIATGSRPIKPPIPGIELPGVRTCWTLEDARAIAAAAKPGSRVLQIGAGFIGCIILEALASRGLELTVVEMGDRMVPRMMTAAAGAMIQRWCEAKGVRVVTGARVESIEDCGSGNGAVRVKLSTGGQVEADFVICAAGVRPNIEFLAGSGIRTGIGVLTDGRMQSSVPGIYAAGDVSAGADFNTGEPVTHAIQPVAVDEARVAALNMAGRECASEGGLAMNVLDTLGLVSTSFGQWSGTAGGEGVEEIDAEHYRYLSLQFEEDILIGATGIGLTDHVGALRGLIQGRIRLGEWKSRLLRDPTRIMEAYLSGAQAQDQWHKVRLR